MTQDEKDCLLGLAKAGLKEPVWINRVVETKVCPVTGGQLFLSATRAREALAVLQSRGYVEADGLQMWTAAVWITEKGLKKAASYENNDVQSVSFRVG